MPAVAFSIASDMELRDGRYFATSNRPWLRWETDAARLAGRWVRLTYATGLLDPLARPVLGIFVGARRREAIMPAALHGRGSWLGWIPEGATEIWISPTCHPGPFSFALESWEVVSALRLRADLFAAHPWRGVKCLWADALGLKEFARLQIRRALCSTPLERYDSWRRAGLRRFDREDFDRPASGVSRLPHFRLVARGEAVAAEAIDALRRRLGLQSYPDWSLVVRGGAAAPAAIDPRIRRVPAEAPQREWAEGLSEDDFLVPLDVDDVLPDYALDALAGEAVRRPDVDLFYADEDLVDRRGRHASPRLKPDWSPILQAASPYLGSAVAIRMGFASRVGAELSEFARALDPPAKVFHIRRVLLSRSRSAGPPSAASAGGARHDAPETWSAALGVAASIIIPTRDRLGLLEGCIASIRTRTAGVKFEVIVVDNDSVEPRTRDYLRRLSEEPDCRVIADPGPFNYSQHCNCAARAARAPFLIFLNNDIEARSEQWLARLLALAARPDVGAVGAKLLYRDGRVQHAGVVLGMDGVASHFQRRASGGDPGYLGSLGSPREVSAVTGACLAVEAAKFAAVGGFDEINLPVEANDVDLCLRLNARGWRTILESRVILTHLESASRGTNAWLDPRYRDQVDYFTRRWADALRDDPYFHPALSLDALYPALG